MGPHRGSLRLIPPRGIKMQIQLFFQVFSRVSIMPSVLEKSYKIIINVIENRYVFFLIPNNSTYLVACYRFGWIKYRHTKELMIFWILRF